MKKFEAVVFDIGNVVLDFDFSILVGKVSRLTSLPAAEIAVRFADSALERDFETGKITPSEFFREVKRGLSLDISFGEFEKNWNEMFSETPGTAELLAELATDYRLLAASNTNAMHLAYIRDRFPVLGIFESIVASCEIGCRKPQPEIYREIALRAGSDPSRILFIDDLFRNVSGAFRAGMSGILFRGIKDLRYQLKVMGVFNECLGRAPKA